MFIGNAAGRDTTDGTQNVGVGTNALLLCGSGDGNTAVGYEAAKAMTGTNCTAVGSGCLVAATGGNSTGVGVGCLNSLLAGTGNTAIGVNAGNTISGGTNNTCIGFNSDCNVAGDNQTAIGNGAVSTANHQIVLGNNDVTRITRGSTNTACSLGTATSPWKDVVSVDFNATGNVEATSYTEGGTSGLIVRDNIANSFYCGSGAGNTMTESVHIGTTSGATSTGSATVSIGHLTLKESVGSSNTVAVGSSAGEFRSTSGANIFVGQFAGRGITAGTNTAVNTVAVGSLALTDLSTGNNNVALGREGLANVTTGTQNVGIGTRAGDTVIGGSDNIFIGYQADGTATAANQIVIGSGAAAIRNNQVVLGNGSVTSLTFGGVLTAGNTEPGGLAVGDFWVTSSHATLPNNVVMMKTS